MQTVEIPWAAWYGDTRHALSFPEGWNISTYHMSDAPGLSGQKIEAIVRDSFAWNNLAQRADSIKSVVIAVDDLTRPTPAAQVLPPLLALLAEAGINREQIQIVLALGNHRVMVHDDLVKKLGRQAATELRVRNHSPFSHLVDLGQTAEGIPIKVNRTFAQADLKIGISGVLPHGITGFSGGAKLILPGLSAIESAYGLHPIRSQNDDTPKSQGDIPPNFEAIRRRMTNFVQAVGIDLMFNIVINSRREIAGLFGGNLDDPWRRAVACAKQVFATPLPPQPVDIAILNAYPKDAEFYQILNAVQIIKNQDQLMVREGGAVVLTSAASEGMGFHYLFGPEGRHPFQFSTEKVVGTRRMLIYSPNAVAAEVRAVFPNVEFFRAWEPLRDRLQTFYGPNCRVAVFPRASIQVASNQGDGDV